MDEEEFVALIAARYVLEEMNFGESIKIYPATTLEDAIVAAVRAEKEGAGVIVCAPVISSLVERMVDVPVVTIKPTESVRKAVEIALKKVEQRL
jgi:predicted transcriptional regulator